MLNLPESIIYDKIHKRYLASNNNTGDIIQIDKNGKQSIFVEGMHAIQGLEIVGNTIYVGARDRVRGLDLSNGKMVMDLKIEGVINLNDVTADDEGNIYVDDVFGTKIYKIRIKDQKCSVFVDGKGIDHPNGIFFDKLNKRILVCSFRNNSPIQAISLADSTVTTLANTNISNCDGIVVDKLGRCYVTSWEPLSIDRFDKDFKNPPELFFTHKCGVADISYDNLHYSIVVPLARCNNYEIIQIRD